MRLLFPYKIMEVCFFVPSRFPPKYEDLVLLNNSRFNRYLESPTCKKELC